MNGYPGIDNRAIICDVCGFRFRVKETTKIQDTYNLLNQMIVCHKCVEKTQPGVMPWPIIEETTLSNPEYVRTEQADVFADNLLAEQLPTAPQNLKAELHPVLNAILLTWQGPEQMGSGRFIGYVITRATPQLSPQVVLEANTETDTPSFVDDVSPLAEESTYQVAAITEFGTGPYSDFAYWPKRTVPWEDIIYLTLSQDTTQILTTGSGLFIRVNHTEAGVV